MALTVFALPVGASASTAAHAPASRAAVEFQRAEDDSGIINSNIYQIQNVNSEKCMEVYHSGKANLDNIDQ